MAIGAQRVDVITMVVRQGVVLSLAGVVCGVAAAFGVTRIMNTLLYHVKAMDPAHAGRGVAAFAVGQPPGLPVACASSHQSRSAGGPSLRIAAEPDAISHLAAWILCLYDCAL